VSLVPVRHIDTAEHPEKRAVYQAMNALLSFFKKGRPSPSYPVLPFVRASGESNIVGLYLLGDVAGKPLIKIGLNDGYELGNRLADELSERPTGAADHHVIVVGAGVAGTATALRLHERGLDVMAVDAGRTFQTLRNFTKGKILFAEPDNLPQLGSLPFEEGDTAEVLAVLDQVIAASGLRIQEHTKVTDVQRDPAGFRVTTERGELTAHRVVISIGKAGNPRKAGVPGELEYPEKISHYLSDPAEFRGKKILIYGGGDVACEAALALCDHNDVTLATIDEAFVFPKKRNIDAIRLKEAEDRLTIHTGAWLKGIGPEDVALEIGGEPVSIPNDQVFEMIGAEVPIGFFKKVGIKLEGVKDTRWWSTLAVSALAIYTLYAWKKGFWPFEYAQGISKWEGILAHPSFWYSALYTLLMTVFGLRAMKRWSRNWTDRYQIYRFSSLICFQLLSFVLIECVLAIFFRDVWWRAYAVNNPFPLLFDSFYGLSDRSPDQIQQTLKWVFVGFGLLMTFVVIPISVRWHGKRFCTWICGCGGLAETLGDQWRHLAAKGERSRRMEVQGSIVLFWAVISAGVILLVYGGDKDAAGAWHGAYALITDFWLVAVIPVALYPLFGGKVWCRYWCPLAKYMQILSAWYGRLTIASNDKCIQCTQCSKYCQVGVDVMAFAKNGEPFSNKNSSCIHCGICITVCPMDVLSFELEPKK